MAKVLVGAWRSAHRGNSSTVRVDGDMERGACRSRQQQRATKDGVSNGEITAMIGRAMTRFKEKALS